MVGDGGGDSNSRGNGGNGRYKNVEETAEAMADVTAEKDLWSK
jgi:hypothetical protein